MELGDDAGVLARGTDLEQLTLHAEALSAGVTISCDCD